MIDFNYTLNKFSNGPDYIFDFNIIRNRVQKFTTVRFDKTS